MKILDQYLCREVLKSSLAVFFVLVLILAGNALLKIMTDVVGGELPKEFIFPLLGVTLVHQSVVLIPFSFFLGVILALGRLYQDAEMTAITGGGVGIVGLYKKITWIILPLFFFLLWMSLYVNAWAVSVEDKLWDDAEKRVEITAISPGKFNANDARSSILFFDEYDKNTTEKKQRLLNTFVRSKRSDNVLVQSAEQANKVVDNETGNVFMSYKNGQMQIDSKNGISLITFEEHAVLLKEKVYPVKDLDDNIEAIPVAELLRSNDQRYHAELQMRLSMPLGAILFILLAVPMSRIAPRKGRYSKLAYAILIYFLYVYLLNLLGSWLANGKVSLVPGVFWLHIIIIFILGLYIHNEGGLPIRSNKKIKASIR